VKLGIRQANNLAWRRLNAPSAARGMKAPHLSKRPTLTGGPFCIEAPSGLAYQRRTTLPRQPQWWHCETPPVFRPLGRRFATSKKAPSVFVLAPSLELVPMGPACGSPKTPGVFCVQAFPGLHCQQQSNSDPPQQSKSDPLQHFCRHALSHFY